MRSCDYVDNDCLSLLAFYQKDTLRKLTLASCGAVTDDGLAHLANMKALRCLVMADLLGVEHPEKCVTMLKESLPECQVSFGEQPAKETSEK